MQGFNLLPWREQKMQRQKQQFLLAFIIVTIISISIIISLHIIIDQKIAELQTAVSVYKQHLQQVKQFEKTATNIIQNKQEFSKLQANKRLPLNILTVLANIMPAKVYLQKLTLHQHHLILIGNADSNNSVAVLMRQLQSTADFVNSVLKEIKSNHTNDEYLHIFVLNLSVKGS